MDQSRTPDLAPDLPDEVPDEDEEEDKDEEIPDAAARVRQAEAALQQAQARVTALHDALPLAQMDFTIDGVKWWSLIIVDGYSRAMLAGAVAPEEATWVALMVLYTACVHYGVPEHLISDGGRRLHLNPL